jgi:hypothetical protein
MINEKYHVFRTDSCLIKHDGTINVIMEKIVNNNDFGKIELIEKTLDPSFGAISYGDFFCMVKINGIWEFAE